MFGFGWMELLVVLAIVLVVFGAGKLPQLGEGLGKAIKGFKKSVHEPEPQLEAQASSMQTLPASAAASMVAPGPQEAGKAPSHT
ncbi:MAG: twin-arginine translocase TatA/TatE family subunit [Nitrospirota bacterium]